MSIIIELTIEVVPGYGFDSSSQPAQDFTANSIGEVPALHSPMGGPPKLLKDGEICTKLYKGIRHTRERQHNRSFIGRAQITQRILQRIGSTRRGKDP